jgi:hypothetical protein
VRGKKAPTPSESDEDMSEEEVKPKKAPARKKSPVKKPAAKAAPAKKPASKDKKPAVKDEDDKEDKAKPKFKCASL